MASRVLLALLLLSVTLVFSAGIYYLCRGVLALETGISLIVSGIVGCVLLYLMVVFVTTGNHHAKIEDRA